VSTAPSLTAVIVRLGADAFAVPAEGVRDTVVNVRPTRVPGAPAWYDGILRWRGKFVPVLNLARRLGLPASDDAAGAVVLVEISGEVVGLRVDALVSEHPVAVTDQVILDPMALVVPTGTVSPFPVVGDRASRRRGFKRA
jgi:purine-binding chemotaxis protein CheW